MNDCNFFSCCKITFDFDVYIINGTIETGSKNICVSPWTAKSGFACAHVLQFCPCEVWWTKKQGYVCQSEWCAVSPVISGNWILPGGADGAGLADQCVLHERVFGSMVFLLLSVRGGMEVHQLCLLFLTLCFHSHFPDILLTSLASFPFPLINI